jgi:hypothetical protein
MSRSTKTLAALTTLSSMQLREKWIALYDGPPPRLPTDLIRLGLAYRLQETAGQGLAARARKELAVQSSDDPPARAPIVVRPGTQLFRSWNGRTISVTVEEEGFLFEGQRYRSLSAIARAVTGAHWSGPRFFGLAG